MGKQDKVLNILPGELRERLSKFLGDTAGLQEIRLRSGRPLAVIYDNREYFIDEKGDFTLNPGQGFVVRHKWIRETMEYVSNYSLYAYEEEMRQGYITIEGGHRVGLAGKIVMEGEQVTQMKHISFMNIRLSHEMVGCGRQLCRYMVEKQRVYNTLLISPPRSGKTTMLRDLVRIFSNGEGLEQGYSVGVVDERSEIAACYMGVPQNDVGVRTDVLDCCPKTQGMSMLLRSMAPQIIAVDEIGGSRDLEALRSAMNCGCSIFATVHGENMEEIRTKPILRSFVDMHLFQRYVILSAGTRIGQVQYIYDDMGNCIYWGEQETA